MPDVLTHFMIGASLAFLVRMDGPRSEQMLIVLGSILLDIERPLSWALSYTPFNWIELSSGFHSIIGALVLACFAAICFELETTDFRTRFYLLLIGCTSHLLLDLIMYPWKELGLQLLYPLKERFSLHLLWPDFLWYPLFGLSLLLIILCIRIIIHRLD